jgi:hypothetical protein
LRRWTRCAAPVIAALDWCRRHGAAVIALLGEEPAAEAPWDLLLYGSLIVDRFPVEPAARRLILSSSEIIGKFAEVPCRR